jgi:hypothetical protein
MSRLPVASSYAFMRRDERMLLLGTTCYNADEMLDELLLDESARAG